MATKPTERILDWANAGTVTDPGGAKEDAGWLISERPPAQWWNWILNSFGKWLSYFETRTDEIKTNVDPITPVAVIKIDTNTGGSPSIDASSSWGATSTGLTLLGAGAGDTGGLVRVSFAANTLINDPIMIGTAYADYTLTPSDSAPLVVTQQDGATSLVEFTTYDTNAGTIVDWDDISTNEEFSVNIMIFGRGTADTGI